MTIGSARLHVLQACGQEPLPVAVRDAVGDVLGARTHAALDARLRDVVSALRVDGSRPDLVRKLEAVLKEEGVR